MTTTPNILFLFSDQHSAWGMSCAGAPLLRTPAMDRLAREGVRFSSAYGPTPLCVPARTALLTGRHGCNTGILRNAGRLLSEEPTFPQALQWAGYRTAIIGKVHLAQGAKPGTQVCDERLHEMGFEDVDAQTGKVFAGCGDVDCSYRRHLKGKNVFDAFRED